MQENKLYTKEQLTKLSEDPDNLVYEYTYDEPKNKKSSSNVGDLYRELLELTNRYYTAHPSASSSDAEEYVLMFPRWMDFRNSHPKIFQHILNRNKSREKDRLILYMIYVLSRQEKGELTPYEADMEIKRFLMTTFTKRSATPDDIKEAQQQNTLRQSVQDPTNVAAFNAGLLS